MGIDFDGHLIVLTFSAGWSMYIRGESPEGFLKRADTVLYTNKRAGKEGNVEVQMT
jgi:PleD family two-component response regulator